jgi:membrane-bound lytic murein transglycosylase F
MKNTSQFLIRYFILCTFTILLAACVSKNESYPKDLPEMTEKRELVATTLYGSTSYFDYRGEEMGFDYEMCKELAESLGLKLRINVSSSVPEMIKKLNTGEVDIIAYRLGITNELKTKFSYTDLEYIDNQVLVQQAGTDAVSNVVDLIGKEIHVNANNKYHQRLLHLNDELGGGIIITTVDDSLIVDDLIQMVALGKIKYTVAQSDIAKLNKTYYKNIDIKIPISFAQRSAWAVRQSSPILLSAVNKWLNEKKDTKAYGKLYNKYFESSKYFTEHEIIIPKGAVSPYDALFKKYAKQLHWDWELLAAIAYHESRFDTAVVSWVGAKGLMQLMPKTAAVFGLDEYEMTNPEKSIDAAVQYIKSLNLMYRKIEDKEERIKFIIASYNSGPAHILDAMVLAEKYEKNPHVWFNNAEEYLRLKSHKEYYSDPVCRNGYFRGDETYRFVKDVLNTYEKYKKRK